MAHKTMLKLSQASVDVMHVLVNAVQADQKLDKAEVNVIVEAMEDIDIRTHDGYALNRIDLLYWLEAHYTDIVAQYSGTKRDLELVILLSRMKRRDDLDPIIKVIAEISLADGEFHEDEQSFLNLVASYWE